MTTKQMSLVVEYPTRFWNDIMTADDKIIEVAKEEFAWYSDKLDVQTEEYEVLGWSRRKSDTKDYYLSDVVVTYTISD